MPAVSQYCSENNLPFEVLLFLNVLDHSKSLQNLYLEISVFFPSNHKQNTTHETNSDVYFKAVFYEEINESIEKEGRE